MKKIILVSILFLILSLSVISVYAVSQDELNQAKVLIDSNISCNQLKNDQLEIIGEYYMEQMMPREAHVRAHEMMGLTEGSEAEEQFHINMAKKIYCGENVGSSMMGGEMTLAFQVFFYLILILVIIVLVLLIILLINKAKQKRRKTK